ncbi:MAG: AbrB/MazE/SpoVT family DNA-binding domain-containing protein [Acidobacteriota bacterium]
MSKVTSKLQVSVPKALADQYGIRPGDEIEWVAAGEIIRVIPPRGHESFPDRQTRLKVFDQATLRQQERQPRKPKMKPPKSRGWKREDLYNRGSSG